MNQDTFWASLPALGGAGLTIFFLAAIATLCLKKSRDDSIAEEKRQVYYLIAGFSGFGILLMALVTWLALVHFAWKLESEMSAKSAHLFLCYS